MPTFAPDIGTLLRLLVYAVCMTVPPLVVHSWVRKKNTSRSEQLLYSALAIYLGWVFANVLLRTGLLGPI